MNAANAANVPLPIKETIAGQAVTKIGTVAATSETVATSASGLATRSVKFGAALSP